ncbi:MAG TPA: hypothetical protein VL326_01625 [Kofleriaceae bacterium]|nr:hypothetical protein [Kofleriaceae bacterium]
MQSTGQPMEQQLGFELGATSLGDLAKPRAGTDPAAGIAVAQHQGRATFALAANDWFHVAFFHERALHENSTEISSTIPPLDDRAALGYGMALAFSVPTSTPGFRIGIDTELTTWGIPYLSFTESSVSSTPDVDRGRDIVGMAALGVTPSYRSGPWTVYGGMTVRNHPTMIEEVTSEWVAPEPDVQEGPFNAIAAAGVGFREDNVEVVADVHQTLTTDPVRYGPAIGVTLKIFGGKNVLPTPHR